LSRNANFNFPNNAKPVVLVAPLDWGLGHATRCIPIIHQFLQADCEVIIAAEGQQRQLLAQEFPSVIMLDLAGYRLKYGKNKGQTLMKIILQAPKMLIKINHEKKWLEKIYRDKHLDIVISDNRYGLYHPKLVSVFITHQLLIKSSLGKWVDGLLQRINYRYIRRFSYCWIPDAADDNRNLAGELSHPVRMPATLNRYIGPLSRIEKENIPSSGRLLVLLSGPEPQRSIFEKKILEDLDRLQRPATIVRGLAQTPAPPASPLLDIHEHLPTAQMQRAINEAGIIISRSGYSTIMDVLPLGKKCIFIPTPGQPEQEYLAAHLAAKGLCCTATQDNFSLPGLLEQADKLQLPELFRDRRDFIIRQKVKDLLAQSPALG
jgi:UDP:flavonoid glycosyltransferase YjiC (YdhE family)